MEPISGSAVGGGGGGGDGCGGGGGGGSGVGGGGGRHGGWGGGGGGAVVALSDRVSSRSRHPHSYSAVLYVMDVVRNNRRTPLSAPRDTGAVVLH